MSNGTFDPERMSNEEAADYLGITSAYLTNLRSLKKGPSYYKSGGIFYKQADLNAYLESTKVVH